MNFSLIIPVYNEASVIVPTLTALRESLQAEHSLDWEIIVVDNASSDGTALLVTGMSDPRIHLLRLDEKGKGRALREGFKAAVGDIIGFTDADLPITPEEMVAAFHQLMKSEHAILVGSRFHSKSTTPGREWWRTGSSRAFNILARHVTGVTALDTQCPLKLVKRSHVGILLTTREHTWFLDLEFIALIEALEIPMLEIPVSWNEHRYPERRSKLSTTRDGLRGVAAMLRIRKNVPAQVEQLSLFRETQ